MAQVLDLWAHEVVRGDISSGVRADRGYRSWGNEQEVLIYNTDRLAIVGCGDLMQLWS